MNYPNTANVKANVDTSGIEKAINLANELVDKINAVKSLAKEFNDIVANIDLSIEVNEKQEDF